MSESVLSMPSSRNFMVSSFPFGSLINVEFLFVESRIIKRQCEAMKLHEFWGQTARPSSSPYELLIRQITSLSLLNSLI